MYQFDAANRGIHPDSGAPSEGETEQQEYPILEIVPDFSEDTALGKLSKPVVLDGKLYVVVFTAADPDGTYLVALDPIAGSHIWTTEILDFGIKGVQPTAMDGVVYVVLPQRVSDEVSGQVQAYDVSTGDELWQALNGRYLYPRMTIRDDRLFVGWRPTVVLDTEGSKLWEYRQGDHIDYLHQGGPPAVTSDRIFASTNAGLTALDHDGTKLWTRKVNDQEEVSERRPVTSPPAVGHYVYVPYGNFKGGANGKLLALDPRDGATVWSFQPELGEEWREETFSTNVPAGEVPPHAAMYNTPVVSGDTLYVEGVRYPDGNDSVDYNLYALDAISGDHLWTSDTYESTLTFTPPVATEDTVYVSTGTGVSLFDPATGARRTHHDLNTYPKSMAIVDDAIIGSEIKSLYVLQ